VLATQRPPEQQPSVQLLPAQHGSPKPPHLAQTPSDPELLHTLPATHGAAPTLAEQQTSPRLPQLTQVLFWQ
jgi:hypothetical protein